MIKRRGQGFTLIEILIAVLIFGIIGVAAYSTLDSAQATQVSLKDRAKRFQDITRALTMLARDYRQLATRRVRDENGELLPLVRVRSDGRENFVEFTRSGWTNPAQLPRSTLEHVIYRAESGQLFRYSYSLLDQAPGSKPGKQLLLDGVKKFELRCMNGNAIQTDMEGNLNTDSWAREWPVGGGVNREDSGRTPAAIQVLMEIEGVGEVYRVLP